ncbi:hypothetical protein B9Z55_007109 [Caenorhabditis nigoni]|uniref:BTB domain-containing protein n=1 Tax=Caenorhabditis nigoni TaxID=1611254 RepID=A0A2G5V838_9PELO|nr:hypothetical protein B9Z55_007109 [Caenorhabditis nigoni]
MSGEAIEYESLTYAISDESKIFGTSVSNGIKCTWSGAIIFDDDGETDHIKFTWKIDWSELKSEGFDRITGFLTVMPQDDSFVEKRIEIDWKETTKTITEIIFVDYDDFYAGDQVIASYKFSLVPHYDVQITNVCYDEILAASELNDTVLLIDGKKAHVNRTFLSYHSEFFRALFSANFKEGKMDEIPIKEVSFEDFGLLLSIIHPKTSFPHDATVQKLLELADRFMMPFVIGHVEHHLLNNSKISNEKMIWMADAYGMPTLLEKTINELNTLEKAKKLKKSTGFQKLSKDARSSILGKIMELI